MKRPRVLRLLATCNHRLLKRSSNLWLSLSLLRSLCLLSLRLVFSYRRRKLKRFSRFCGKYGYWINRVFDESTSRWTSSGDTNLSVHCHSLPLFSHRPLAWRESLGQWIHYRHFSRKLLLVFGVTVLILYVFFFWFLIVLFDLP